MSSNRIITITTDFGNSFFSGILKGVILNIESSLQIIDITHNISKFNVEEAKFVVENSYKYFPEKTIHLIVVDPGVGSERKPLIVETYQYFFVGPDNGVLSFLNREDIKNIYEITFDEKDISSTFHGRDIFAPAAANLAINRNIISFTKKISLENTITFSYKNNIKKFKVVFIDDFGNIFLNLKEKDFKEKTLNKKWELFFKNHKFSKLANNYFSVKKGDLLLLINSFNYLEIAMREGNAAKALKAKIGDEFYIRTH